jgi:hypothetical protein
LTNNLKEFIVILFSIIKKGYAMPCWTITETKLDLSKANSLVLKDALTKLGMRIEVQTADRIVAHKGNTTVTWIKGKGTTVRGSDQTIAENLPKTYSQAAIAYAAKVNRWNVIKTDENHFAVVRT